MGQQHCPANSHDQTDNASKYKEKIITNRQNNGYAYLTIHGISTIPNRLEKPVHPPKNVNVTPFDLVVGMLGCRRLFTCWNITAKSFHPPDE